MKQNKTILIATRGSALALAQAGMVLAQCRGKFPKLSFELKVIRTNGDKLLTASMANPDSSLPKGLFTKELEVALLKRRADLAVHSLKDLPTDLPEGLILGAVAGRRADVRDILIYKPPLAPGLKPAQLPRGLTVATSSTRRQAQLLALRHHSGRGRPGAAAISIDRGGPAGRRRRAGRFVVDDARNGRHAALRGPGGHRPGDARRRPAGRLSVPRVE